MLGLITAMLFPSAWLSIGTGIIIFALLVALRYKAVNKVSVLAGLFCLVIGMMSYTVTFQHKTETIQKLVNQEATVTATVTKRHFTPKGKIVYTLQTDKIMPKNPHLKNCPQNLKLECVTKTDFYAEMYEIVVFDVQFSAQNSSVSYTFDSFANGVYLNTSVVSKKPRILMQSTGDCFYTMRCHIYDKLAAYFHSKETGLIFAFLTGDKSAVYSSVKDSFKTAGISHIIAISGLHLSVIVGVVFRLLRRITRNMMIVSSVTVIFIVFYVFLTAYPYSIIRSAVMNILFVTAIPLHRKSQPLNSLGLAGLLITVVNPLAIGDIGLLMSFSATLGIILLQKTVSQFTEKLFFVRYIHQPFLQKCLKIPVNYIAECVGVSVSAVVFTLPVMIFVYKRFSVYFILSNLLTAAVAPVVIVLGLLIVVLSYIPYIEMINGIFVFAEHHLCDFIITTADSISEMPHASISLDSIYTEIALVSVLVTVVLLFITGDFRIKEKGLCMVLCTAIVSLILLFGYVIEKNTLDFYVTGNSKGVSLVEKNFTSANILLCGGDNYHYDDTENLFFDKDIRSLFVFGNKAYFENYALRISEQYNVENIITYTDSEDYRYLSAENPVTHIPENGIIRYPKYSLQTFTVNQKNWCYIDMQSGKGILIAPKNADCNDLPPQYRNVYIAILPNKCRNSQILSAENILVCDGNTTFIIHKSLNGGISLWQK